MTERMLASAAASILIPFRADTPHRSNLRAWQYGYLNVTYPDTSVIVASDGLPSDKPFCRSAALNRARDLAFTDWLWCMDADAAPAPGDLALGLDAAQATGWAVVYAGVLQLDRVGTRYVLDGRSTVHDWNACHARGLAHGLLLIHAQLWDDVGGWDEHYVGWGYEDADMHARLVAAAGAPPPPPVPWIRTLGHPRDYPARPTALNADRYHATHGR